MSALSRAHVLVLVDTVAEEFDAAICYGAAQEQEAVLVPNTDPHYRSLTHVRTSVACFQLPNYGRSFLSDATLVLGGERLPSTRPVLRKTDCVFQTVEQILSKARFPTR